MLLVEGNTNDDGECGGYGLREAMLASAAAGR